MPREDTVLERLLLTVGEMKDGLVVVHFVGGTLGKDLRSSFGEHTQISCRLPPSPLLTFREMKPLDDS